MGKPYLTTLDDDGWMIDDAEAAQAATPDTYWIPDLDIRNSLQIRDFAKIRFYIRTEDDDGEIEDHGERMWVKVVGQLEDWYRGELANQPSATPEIKPGFEVWFQARHVINIQRADPGEPAAPNNSFKPRPLRGSA